MNLLKDGITKRIQLRSSFFIFTLLICSFSFGQSNYSVDPNYIKKRTENTGTQTEYANSYPDTNIHSIHNFIKRNYLGNIGLSSPNYHLKFGSPSMGFKLYQFPLSDYHFNKEDIEYYKTKGPFAQVSGFAGSKQLQMLRMLFSNSFKNNLNVTLKLNRYTSTGYYAKQQSFTNNFYLSTNYTTKNNRFGFNSYVLVNNNGFQENGGIAIDTLSQKDLLVTKTLIPTKLSNASRNNREFSAMYSNWFRLNKSADNNIQSYLQLKSSFNTFKYRYRDNGIEADNYYFLFYLDTAATLDSTRLRTYSNELLFTLQSKNKAFNFNIGYENEINQIWQYSDTTFMNHIVHSNISHTKKFLTSDSLNYSNLINSGSVDYIAAGSQSSNYKIESKHALNFYRNNKLKESVQIRLLAEDRMPDYIYRRWYSNHFIWENKFNNTQTVQGELSVKIPMLQLSAIYKGITNYVYFDQLAYPMQQAGTISNTALKLDFENVFFKHIGVKLDQTFQTTSSSLISLPKSISQAALYYKGNLFKKNLQLCIGGQVEYFDGFSPYAYMPATQAFYVQESFKAGNFTFVDVFLNARIRPVTIFFKMENVLHGMLGTNYSMVPGYYQPERAIRFGLTWLFFD